MANQATIDMAKVTREQLGGSAITERQAKLYSQRLRRDMGQAGLASFQAGDVASYLDEAMLLLNCALLERSGDPTSEWRNGLKRAAEILEWLSHPSLKPENAPLHLLSAAAYQLADYPAMALGQLQRVPSNEFNSVLLREFLRANFPGCLEAAREFWKSQHAHGLSARVDKSDLGTITYQHVVMCIGTVCAYIRTGNNSIVDRALQKLDNLATSLLHSRDSYSYLLAKLTAGVGRRFVESSFWPQIALLGENSTDTATAAFVQFARSAFVNRRSLVWPAQAVGIEQLRTNSSFVLCTPTGSGKTTVATLAVVQSLFTDTQQEFDLIDGEAAGNLALYLVPSRALAAEVESKFSQDLDGITADPVVVTGLYGGIDWGPTDAWIQTDRATIVICTYEKADALIRYLGILFLNRVKLVVIDEAHMVEQDRSRLDGLRDGSSRSYRLEQLAARIFRARDRHNFRVVVLSAVAASAAPALARWISGEPDATPTSSSYRSTRQMLGRLEVSDGGQFGIHYELMDGHSLQFMEENTRNTPYVINPFPALPDAISPKLGPELRMRAPTLWAALQLASERPDGTTPSVLISVTQNIETFAGTCAELMDEWQDLELPNYRAVDETNELWVRCLAAAADYFTTNSFEYRLLRHGIAVHHGKMPGLLARRLKTVIDRGIVRVVIATSTLSEGVNIPVSYLLIPSVYRSATPLPLQEFSNLIGRVGRPGVATEGIALVVLPQRTMRRGKYEYTGRQWPGYELLITSLKEVTASGQTNQPVDAASSPLAHLLRALESAWVEMTTGGTSDDFSAWLEQTAISNEDEIDLTHEYLDSLDTFLIAAIQEVEELNRAELGPVEIEEELQRIWRRTYAFAAASEQENLEAIWLTRGAAIKDLYPNTARRRQIYKSSLSPRSATRLLQQAETIRNALQAGTDYAQWSVEQQFDFICDILAQLSHVPSFRIATTLGRKKNFENWQKLLRWWLNKSTLSKQPTAKEITVWYQYVSQNFIYRGAWGLGSVIGVLLDGEDGTEPVRALEIADWPKSGLPWIAFWLKELITWGTLDPVVAFLLARGDAIDRVQAATDAKQYYATVAVGLEANDMLDPRTIRNWVENRRTRSNQNNRLPQMSISATLVRPSKDYRESQMAVLPLDVDQSILWVESAGYPVARSEKPKTWPENPASLEFELNTVTSTITGSPYLTYRFQS